MRRAVRLAPAGTRKRTALYAGRPTVVGAPDSRAADIYRAIARRIAVKVAERAKDMSAKFPNIVVQNT